MATNFPTRAKRGDPDGHMIVQQMLEFLRDVFDKFTNTVVRGQSIILATQTSVAVSFTVAPGSTYSIVVQPLSDPGGRYWVSSKTALGFTINLQVAAPVGGITFDWIAKGA